MVAQAFHFPVSNDNNCQKAVSAPFTVATDLQTVPILPVTAAGGTCLSILDDSVLFLDTNPTTALTDALSRRCKFVDKTNVPPDVVRALLPGDTTRFARHAAKHPTAKADECILEWLLQAGPVDALLDLPFFKCCDGKFRTGRNLCVPPSGDYGIAAACLQSQVANVVDVGGLAGTALLRELLPSEAATTLVYDVLFAHLDDYRVILDGSTCHIGLGQNIQLLRQACDVAESILECMGAVLQTW